MESGLLVSDGRRPPPRDPWSVSVLERGRFLLTARDILERRMRARLVTLNACSSGLQGERNAGDELDGFARALLLAGARSVLLTLWNVDQISSSEFLARFYERWLDPRSGVSKWRALHETQKAFLAERHDYLRHPYHWAPFTLLGDWR
jgi:CHAT domain-containing protein